MNFALKVAQRIRTQNRRLVVAWVAMLSAVIAAGALGYSWKNIDAPLVFGEETCTTVVDELWICSQGEKRFLVVPLND